MNARRKRTTPPQSTPAPSAAAVPASTAGSSGQPERTSSAEVKAPIAMNAPVPSDGSPAGPTVSPSAVAASAR